MMTEDLQRWAASLSTILHHVRAVRRELHAHPEVSGQERETKARILRELTALGIETVEFEGCNGVMGILRNGAGRCVAIRADMDALPVQEETGLPFASEQPGVMHACGHDVHMAMALGSARWLSEHRDAWHGTVKWLFEPMEETLGGSQFMVAQGCMKNPDVDWVIGQHVNPRYPAGTFYCKPGFVSGASDELFLTVRGQSCHGAYPESGTDAIVIAAQVISALQILISRNISPFEPAALTIGEIHGGRTNNVVCGEVKMHGTLRTLSPEIREKLKARIRQTVASVAEGMGGTGETEFRPGYGAVRNDDAAYAMVEDCARALLGSDRMVKRAAASLGVESMCYFMAETPGVYYDIGSGLSTALHTPTLMIDEEVLLPGTAMQCACALRLLGCAE